MWTESAPGAEEYHDGLQWEPGPLEAGTIYKE
jgi:hypothetical protein